MSNKTYSEYTGIEKGAILMIALGPEKSSSVFRYLKDEEIEAFIVASYPDGIEQKQMGNVIKEVKAKWNAADGKTVSELVRKHIKH